VVRPILLNSTYIGTSTAIGGSIRMASRPKNRKFRPKKGDRRRRHKRRERRRHTDRLTAPLETKKAVDEGLHEIRSPEQPRR